MPRILCYLHSFEPGGVERMALRLCAAWRADGLDVTLAIGRREGVLEREGEVPAYVTLPRPGFSTRRFETLWMLLWLPGLVRRTRPDLIFCAGNSYTIVAVVLRLMLRGDCPPIVAKLSNDLARPEMVAPVRRLYHLWCRIQGRTIGRFVALSAAMRDEAAMLLGVARDTIAVIADPVLTDADIATLAAAGERARCSGAFSSGRRFLAVGRLAPQKNFALLLRAFARSAQADDRLVILGEGPQRAKLERLVWSLGLIGRVTLPGHSPDVARWLARSDVFVLPSRYEGAPAVVVEALAAGLPVVATDCCRSMAGLLDRSPDCAIVPVDDEAALAAAMTLPRRHTVEVAAAALRHRAVLSGHAYAQMFAGMLATERATELPSTVPSAV